LPIDQLKELRDVCTKYDVPLIFDEIQTGFGSSGNVWYSERIGVKPDITVFGKKSQVSGIMVNASHSKVFEVPKRLSVTFDGDLVDMVRCQYIIKAIKELKLLETMPEKSSFFANALKSFGVFDNIKATGFLFCLDMKDNKSRDMMVKNLHSNGMICNPTGERSIRMRPNLYTTMKEFSDAKTIIENSL
jgi:L-lysine 6-transaminase